jgi:hypothetical protein
MSPDGWRWCTTPGTMSSTPTRVFCSRQEPSWEAALMGIPGCTAYSEDICRFVKAPSLPRAWERRH